MDYMIILRLLRVAQDGRRVVSTGSNTGFCKSFCRPKLHSLGVTAVMFPQSGLHRNKSAVYKGISPNDRRGQVTFRGGCVVHSLILGIQTVQITIAITIAILYGLNPARVSF